MPAAVARLRVGADRAAMLEVQQDLQALLDDVVRLAVVQVGDEADAAGIALVQRIEQAFRLGKVWVVNLGHHGRISGRVDIGGGIGGRAFERAARSVGLCSPDPRRLVPAHRLLRSVRHHRWLRLIRAASLMTANGGGHPRDVARIRAKSKSVQEEEARTANGQQRCPIVGGRTCQI